jgi:prefoldin subunit 5
MPNSQNEVDALKSEAEVLKSSLEAVERRINELEASRTGE